MAGKRRRRFGYVRKLPSGRYQASYTAPDGTRQYAPDTFKNKTEADRWLSLAEADISRGVVLNEQIARQPFGSYARAYLRDNPKVGPRWRETCLRNLRLHLAALEDKPLALITTPVVREWYSVAMRGTGGRTSIQQAYRFLRAVLYQAMRDGGLGRNPCQVPGAGTDRAKERPVATPGQVKVLVEAIIPRYRAAVMIAAWTALRRGEICALKVGDVDLAHGTITVRENRIELLESRQAFDGDPKSDAGKRTVVLPKHVIPYLKEHLERWAGKERLFVGRDGKPMRGDAIRQAFTRARAKVGMEGFTFHDMRHTGSTLAASAGATLADLKKRLGHSSSAAALRYLHAVDGRDREIADALANLAEHGDAARLPRSIVMKH